jgi:hypothetical protein
MRMVPIVLAAAFLATPAFALDMKLTIYDDGKSCPGDCDAHVVINSNDNGTRFAFLPGSSRGTPQKCKAGEACTICFGEPVNTCMDALYRGGGPPAGKFDFTPAFYDENCGRDDIPKALKDQCAALDAAVVNGGYNSRINCFDNPGHAKCTAAMAAAAAAQQADEPKRELCLSLGESSYNSQQSNAKDRRSNGCNYSQQRLGGPNSNGVRWRMLLPGACRAGTFVGRDGLDCCSSNLRFAASIHPECTGFFPKPS